MHTWPQVTGQDVNPKKLVSFVVPNSDMTIQMRGLPFLKQSEFCSLGVGSRTTDAVSSGLLILKRIGKASVLLDWVQGIQGNFEDCCKVVSTMVNAIGLHASEIVPISLKDVRPFETKILHTRLGCL